VIVIPVGTARPLLGIDVRRDMQLSGDDTWERWARPLRCLWRDTYQLVPTNEALTCWITYRRYWLRSTRQIVEAQIPIFTPPGQPHWLTVLNPQETNP
jgi:hypothetical protein